MSHEKYEQALIMRPTDMAGRQQPQPMLRIGPFNNSPAQISQPPLIMSPHQYASDLLGDGCVADAQAYSCDRARRLPPWLSDAANNEVDRVNNDYDDVGSVGQARAALKTLYAIGQFSQSRSALTVVAPIASVSFPGTIAPAAIGVRIDWSIAQQFNSSFDLQIVLGGWRTLCVGATAGAFPLSSQNMNRLFTARVNGLRPGGSIFVPFATRPTGMSQARIGLAVPENDEATSGLVQISGIPTAFTANNAFSAIASLLCAHHPDTAAFARAYGVFDGGL